MANQPPWSRRRIHQHARWHIRYDDHGDQPAKDKLDEPFEDDIGIASEVHDAVIAPDQSLSSFSANWNVSDKRDSSEFQQISSPLRGRNGSEHEMAEGQAAVSVRHQQGTHEEAP
jgi:hypothetical protein